MTFSLEQNYPNPFNSETTFRYNLGETSHIDISIYNEMGQLVCNLVDEKKESGHYTIKWDGSNNHGNSLGTGLYFIKIKTDKSVSVRKVLFIK
jgi:flagellar hook assembly protein FlgD